MPRKTFLRLPDVKRDAFITACLDEFSRNDYDSASISAIVRNLGIAKGSVYQYFEDKKDLWLYLRQRAEQERLRYLKEVYRSSFDDFYGYFAALQQKELLFSREHALESRFLFRAVSLETSSALHQEVEPGKQQQLRDFFNGKKPLVEAEKSNKGSLGRFPFANRDGRHVFCTIGKFIHIRKNILSGSYQVKCTPTGEKTWFIKKKKKNETVIDRLKGIVFSFSAVESYGEETRKPWSSELMNDGS